MPVQPDFEPRRRAIVVRGRQDSAKNVEMATRATYGTFIAEMLQQRLDGGTISEANLATIDDLNRASHEIFAVRSQVLALISDTTKTFEDYVPIDGPTEYNKPYTRPSFWTTIPWVTPSQLSSESSARSSSDASLQTQIDAAQSTLSTLGSAAFQPTSAFDAAGTAAAVTWSTLPGKPTLFSGSWNDLTSKPTTLSGYGITDAYPLAGNPSGFLTGITSGQITTALGFTPYSATNPTGYISQSGARTAITLTTTGTTGAATYNSTSGVLNVPQYQNSGGTVTTVSGALPITSTGGNTPSIGINAATISAAGSMSAVDKTKLDGGGLNKLIGTVTISESGITVALGVRRITVALTGAVATGNYSAFAVSALTAGYSIQDCICTTNGQITVGMLVPALVVGSYSFQLRIVQVQTS